MIRRWKILKLQRIGENLRKLFPERFDHIGHCQALCVGAALRAKMMSLFQAIGNDIAFHHASVAELQVAVGTLPLCRYSRMIGAIHSLHAFGPPFFGDEQHKDSYSRSNMVTAMCGKNKLPGYFFLLYSAKCYFSLPGVFGL